MHSPNNFVILICSIEENDRTVRQTSRDRIFIWTEFYSKNYSDTLDIFNPLHSLTLIDSDKPHVLLIQDNLVYLLEIKDFFYELIMGRFVLNIRLDIPHINVGVGA